MFESKQFDGSSGSIPSTGVGGAALTVVSILVSALSYSALSGEIRIHWSLGGPHYGPEFAPAWLVLLAFPVLVGVLALGARQLRQFLIRSGEYEAVGRLYEVGVVAVLGVVVLAQCLLVVGNLA